MSDLANGGADSWGKLQQEWSMLHSLVTEPQPEPPKPELPNPPRDTTHRRMRDRMGKLLVTDFGGTNTAGKGSASRSGTSPGAKSSSSSSSTGGSNYVTPDLTPTGTRAASRAEELNDTTTEAEGGGGDAPPTPNSSITPAPPPTPTPAQAAAAQEGLLISAQRRNASLQSRLDSEQHKRKAAESELAATAARHASVDEDHTRLAALEAANASTITGLHSRVTTLEGSVASLKKERTALKAAARGRGGEEAYRDMGIGGGGGEGEADDAVEVLSGMLRCSKDAYDTLHIRFVALKEKSEGEVAGLKKELEEVRASKVEKKSEAGAESGPQVSAEFVYWTAMSSASAVATAAAAVKSKSSAVSPVPPTAAQFKALEERLKDTKAELGREQAHAARLERRLEEAKGGRKVYDDGID